MPLRRALPYAVIRKTFGLVAVLAVANVACAAPLAEEVKEAVRVIGKSDGFRPRQPFYLMEQETPRLAGDAEARLALAALLKQTADAPGVNPNAKTVLMQYLYQVSADAVPVIALKPPDTAAAYLAMLNDAQPARRIAALTALANFYPAEAKSPCVKALKDADAKVRATAVQCLVKADVSALAQGVPSLDAAAQVAALDALADTKAKGARGIAVQLVDAEDGGVRDAALRLLGAVGGADDVAFLAERGAVDALAQLTGEGVDEAIFKLLDSPGKTATRVTLVNVAAIRNADERLYAFLHLAYDIDGKVRVAALKALGRVGGESEYLVMFDKGAIVTDTDAWVDAMKQMGRRMTDRWTRLKPILYLFDDKGYLPDVDVVHVAALRLLVPLGGDDEALAAVRTCLDSPIETIRDAAVRALTEWQDAAAFPDLQKIAADEKASKTHRTLAERAVARMRESWSRLSAQVYMNCGTEREASGKNGVKLRVANGEAWRFDDSAEGTVFFAGDELRVEVTGLADGKPHLLGFTWWDYDGNGRAQSVWVNGRMALEPTPLPNFKARQERADVRSVVIPGDLIKGGKADIRFKREGASNALVGEVWMGVAPEGAEAKLPEPPPLAEVRANPGAAKKVLILTGLEHHNNWKQNTPRLVAAFAEDTRLEVSVSEAPEVMTKPDVLAKYDAFVLYYNNSDKKPSPAGALANLAKAVEADGKGLVLVHFASGAFYDWETEKVDAAFGKIAGRVWNPKFRAHDPHGTFTVNIADKEHPITKGLADFETVDELYTCLDGDAPIHVLATAVSKVDQKVYPMAFILNPGKGRTFHCALGHDDKAFTAKPLELFKRGTLWAIGL
ncbi:MAG: ThuA domain-containing protein [Kiritimatiellaeota bacterium]|nr:ThuA domain-containing protein [Kiritimatiellota bacterium]